MNSSHRGVQAHYFGIKEDETDCVHSVSECVATIGTCETAPTCDAKRPLRIWRLGELSKRRMRFLVLMDGQRRLER